MEKTMSRIIVRLNFSIVFLFLSVSGLFGQHWADPNGTINNQLMSLVRTRYDATLQYVQFTIFDTLISYATIENNKNIQDPYKTLKGCILFSTYKDNGDNEPDNFIVGIVKDGKLIWDNAPGTSADLGGDLLYTQDINNDGEIDLIFSIREREIFGMGKPPFLYYLYALSWNGTRGRFINADGDHIMMGNGGFELVDTNQDGIQEIITALPDIDMDWGKYKTSTFPRITYSWNGKEYGFWPEAKQINKSTKSKK